MFSVRADYVLSSLNVTFENSSSMYCFSAFEVFCADPSHIYRGSPTYASSNPNRSFHHILLVPKRIHRWRPGIFALPFESRQKPATYAEPATCSDPTSRNRRT